MTVTRAGGRGGFFVDVTIHDLDTARWMVGEIVEVTAHGDALAAFDLARAAEESWRWGRTITVQPQRSGGNVRYTVKQENR